MNWYTNLLIKWTLEKQSRHLHVNVFQFNGYCAQLQLKTSQHSMSSESYLVELVLVSPVFDKPEGKEVATVNRLLDK